ncbi:MAG: patatin-like phospholipase family protein [Opitutaceae bacterium]|jgi:NTE family protein
MKSIHSFNRPAADAVRAPQPNVRQTTRSSNDGWGVALAFSGGGTRAAAFAYGVLEELARTPIRRSGASQWMLDRVRVITGVSGGSFTAAYYALHGERIFCDYEKTFLKRDVQRELMRELARPQNLLKLARNRIGRSEIASDFYHKEIFGGATFGDILHRTNRPELIVNATDMITGLPFAFTQQNFDLIGSDLATFPVARAIAASAAAPVLLSPVTLLNHSASNPAAWPAFAQQVNAELSDPQVPRRVATAIRSYFDTSSRPFIHLVDGGLSDYLGLHGLLDMSLPTRNIDNALREHHHADIRNIAVIVVNAAAERSAQWNTRSHLSIPQVLRAVSNAVTQYNGTRALADFRRRLESWRQDGVGRAFHLVEISFDQLADPEERSLLLNLPTSLSLPAETVDRLRKVGARLLRESSAFQEFLRDFNDDGGKPEVVDVVAKLALAGLAQGAVERGGKPTARQAEDRLKML